MFFKINVKGMELKTIQRLVHQHAIYGMQIDKVRQCLTDRYHIYHAYDHRTISYLMIFWSKSGPKVSGCISFDKDLKARAIHFSMGHSLERWFAPEWTYILPESRYRRLTESMIDEDAFDDDMLSDVERYNVVFLERYMEPLFFSA